MVKIKKTASYKVKYWLIWCLCGCWLAGTLPSCRTEVEKAQIELAKKKEQQRREGYRAYKKAFKQHLNNQSKDTRKRIKKELRQQKKKYRQKGLGGRYKKTCVPD